MIMTSLADKDKTKSTMKYIEDYEKHNQYILDPNTSHDQYHPPNYYALHPSDSFNNNDVDMNHEQALEDDEHSQLISSIYEPNQQENHYEYLEATISKAVSDTPMDGSSGPSYCDTTFLENANLTSMVHKTLV